MDSRKRLAELRAIRKAENAASSQRSRDRVLLGVSKKHDENLAKKVFAAEVLALVPELTPLAVEDLRAKQHPKLDDPEPISPDDRYDAALLLLQLSKSVWDMHMNLSGRSPTPEYIKKWVEDKGTLIKIECHPLLREFVMTVLGLCAKSLAECEANRTEIKQHLRDKTFGVL